MRAASSSGLEQALAAARHNADGPVLVEAVLAPRQMPPIGRAGLRRVARLPSRFWHLIATP